MRLLIITLLAAAMILQVSGKAAASTSAERAEELFLEGQYAKSMAAADRAIAADSGKRYELYYLKGLSAIKLNKFAEARRSFEYVIERYPRSGRALDSYVGMGDAYYLEGNTQGALRSYKAAADAFPDDKNIVVVRQRISECMSKSAALAKPREYVPAPQPVESRRGTVNFTPKAKRYIQAEPPAQKSAARDRAGQFCVQVGSFSKKANASRLASKLSAKGYDAYVESPAGQANKLYRVRVGRAKSKEESEKLAVRLKREGYPTKVCRED